VNLLMRIWSTRIRGQRRFGWFAIVLLAAAPGTADAADLFQSAPGPEPAPQAKPAPRPPAAAPARPAERGAPPAVAAPSAAPVSAPPLASGPTYDDELHDYGMAPVNAIRTGGYEGPTPLTIAGARTITTGQLQAMASSGRPPVLLDVLEGTQTISLPGTVWSPGSGKGNSLDDGLQQSVARLLERVTGGNKAAAVVVFCLSKTCWLSHNAALRAVALGYSNVYWYRGGRNAWQAAGLQMAPVSRYVPDWPAIAITPPDRSIPASLARFSGVWHGQWNGGNYAALGVKTVRPDGLADIEYWWQAAQGQDFRRLSFQLAKIDNGVLAFGSVRLVIDAQDPRQASSTAGGNSTGKFTKQ
jgi:PQQ-dependent catabolism-associated CXXCW motif protein